MKRGAEFGELNRRLRTGLDNRLIRFPLSAEGLDEGSPFRFFVDPPPDGSGGTQYDLEGLNTFRLGQQIHMWIGIANPILLLGTDPATANWITRLQLKPWWARPNLEYRCAGFPTWTGLDNATFLPGPGPSAPTGNRNNNNKYVWIPSPKLLEATQYQTPPPAAAPVRHCDSIMLDDVWTWDLQDPNDTDYQDDFPAPQVVSRWDSFWYPAHGYALAFTWEVEQAFTPGPDRSDPLPFVSVTYAVGTLEADSTSSESLG